MRLGIKEIWYQAEIYNDSGGQRLIGDFETLPLAVSAVERETANGAGQYSTRITRNTCELVVDEKCKVVAK